MNSAKAGEYLIQIEQSGHVTVHRIYDNVKGSLKEIYESKGLEYDPAWNARQMGTNLIKQLGGQTSATSGEYIILKKEDGSIETYRDFGKGNVKNALRTIATEIGMEFDPDWNTQTFGRNIINFISK